MMLVRLCLIAVLWIAAPTMSAAAGATLDGATEQRYHHLLEQLRCLVCQNESLAASHADLAEDLRAEVRTMMEAGRSNQDIIDFLVHRYGDFVLYRPPVKPSTYMLWGGPFLLLAVALGVLGWVVRYRARAADPPLSSAEQARLERLRQRREGEPGG